VPVYNQHELTQSCIDAITCNTYSDYEIIIIDNGSEPFICPTISYKKNNYQSIDVIIRNEANLGFPVATNQGIKKSKGDTIILLNNDVIVTPNWTFQLLNLLNKYDIVGPMTNYCAGKQQITIPCYNNENELNIEAEMFAAKNFGQSEEVNWVIGFCMAFKRSLYDELGPFDESAWPCSGEELDFCLSARSKGYKIAIAKDSYVHHFGSMTFKAMQLTGESDYDKICKTNNQRVTDKWGEFWSKQSIAERIIK
jgi:GT2 family glycosyltransferase